jgi:quercetin dioxygenase-like cupin family protein
VAVVVISSAEKGDRLDGSLEVKVPMAGKFPVRSAQGASKYAMQVLSAAFTPEMYSLVHHHSGVEAVYVIQGEACYETPTHAFKLRKGETVALPGGMPMRAAVTGSKLRYVLAVIVYDAAQPPTMRMEDGAGPRLVACK